MPIINGFLCVPVIMLIYHSYSTWDNSVRLIYLLHRLRYKPLLPYYLPWQAAVRCYDWPQNSSDALPADSLNVQINCLFWRCIPIGHFLGSLLPCVCSIFLQWPFSVFCFSISVSHDIAKLHILISKLWGLYSSWQSVLSLWDLFVLEFNKSITKFCKFDN